MALVKCPQCNGTFQAQGTAPQTPTCPRCNRAPAAETANVIRVTTSVVVFALIALILLGGISAWYFAARKDDADDESDKTAETSDEIALLAKAVQSYRHTFGVDYVPSKFDPAEPESQFYMMRCFPQTSPEYWSRVPIMEGDQCLVFFLGGKQADGACVGFSSNPKDPLAAAGEKRIGPFFAFKSSRLKQLHGGFPSYLDLFGQKPFAYFSTIGAPNSYADTDCNAIGAKPYLKGGTDYVNPHSFQILSAGADKQFGPGGVYDAKQISAGPGRDDVSNFVTRRLGDP